MTYFRVCLYSKRTGEHHYLGASFATLEEMQSYVDREICTRCNRVERVQISETSRYENSRIGFVE
jgi:hypothetical protein